MSAELLRRGEKGLRVEARKHLPGGRYERTFAAIATLMDQVANDLEVSADLRPLGGRHPEQASVADMLADVARAYLGEAAS